jgi:hypothetical protein
MANRTFRSAIAYPDRKPRSRIPISRPVRQATEGVASPPETQTASHLLIGLDAYP